MDNHNSLVIENHLSSNPNLIFNSETVSRLAEHPPVYRNEIEAVKQIFLSLNANNRLHQIGNNSWVGRSIMWISRKLYYSLWKTDAFHMVQAEFVNYQTFRAEKIKEHREAFIAKANKCTDEQGKPAPFLGMTPEIISKCLDAYFDGKAVGFRHNKFYNTRGFLIETVPAVLRAHRVATYDPYFSCQASNPGQAFFKIKTFHKNAMAYRTRYDSLVKGFNSLKQHLGDSVSRISLEAWLNKYAHEFTSDVEQAFDRMEFDLINYIRNNLPGNHPCKHGFLNGKLMSFEKKVENWLTNSVNGQPWSDIRSDPLKRKLYLGVMGAFPELRENVITVKAGNAKCELNLDVVKKSSNCGLARHLPAKGGSLELPEFCAPYLDRFQNFLLNNDFGQNRDLDYLMNMHYICSRLDILTGSLCDSDIPSRVRTPEDIQKIIWFLERVNDEQYSARFKRILSSSTQSIISTVASGTNAIIAHTDEDFTFKSGYSTSLACNILKLFNIKSVAVDFQYKDSREIEEFYNALSKNSIKSLTITYEKDGLNGFNFDLLEKLLLLTKDKIDLRKCRIDQFVNSSNIERFTKALGTANSELSLAGLSPELRFKISLLNQTLNSQIREVGHILKEIDKDESLLKEELVFQDVVNWMKKVPAELLRSRPSTGDLYKRLIDSFEIDTDKIEFIVGDVSKYQVDRKLAAIISPLVEDSRFPSTIQFPDTNSTKVLALFLGFFQDKVIHYAGLQLWELCILYKLADYPFMITKILNGCQQRMKEILLSNRNPNKLLNFAKWLKRLRTSDKNLDKFMARDFVLQILNVEVSANVTSKGQLRVFIANNLWPAQAKLEAMRALDYVESVTVA